jgi:serine/threonine protein kinase
VSERPDQDRSDPFSPSDEALEAGLAAGFGLPPASVVEALATDPPGAGERPADLGPAGKYQLLEEIARGGMGAVLKGRDVDLGRDVAVKVLLEQHAGRTELLQRFAEEAQIAGQLQHPGIVPVYDVGRVRGRPFFTMKLVTPSWKGAATPRRTATGCSWSSSRSVRRWPTPTRAG